MGKLIKVKANHPIYNSLGIKGFPAIVGCGEVIEVDESTLKAFGKKNFTILSKSTKDIPAEEKEDKGLKVMTTGKGKKK